MSANLYREFIDLLPARPLQVGTVTARSGDSDSDSASVQLPGVGLLAVRGEGAIGARVFVRDGVIEGPAPAYPIELIEI